MKTKPGGLADEMCAVGMLTLIVIMLMGTMLGGCTSTSGWQVGFGVYPVTQIRNVQSLQGNQRVTTDVKRVPATKSQNVEEDY